MSSRTERWRTTVRPGSPAPPDIFKPTRPPPLVTPDCSISNVGIGTRHPITTTTMTTTRARSSSTNSPPRTYQHYPRHTQPPPPLPNYYSPNRAPYATRPHTPVRAATYESYSAGETRASAGRSARSHDRRGLYVIPAPRGPNVQILYPQRSGSSPLPYTHHRSYSPTPEKSLFRRVLDKFSNGDKDNFHSRARSSSAFPQPTKYQYPLQSYNNNRSRRNSTGSSDKWHIVPGEPKYTSRGGRSYRVI